MRTKFLAKGHEFINIIEQVRPDYKTGKNYDPPCEFCGHLDDFDDDPKLKTMSENLEKLPGLAEEVCKLHEELEEQLQNVSTLDDSTLSLNSSIDLEEIASFKPTCCETSIVNFMGKFRLSSSKSKRFLGLKKAWYSGVQRLVPKTRDIRTYFTTKTG